MNPQLKSSATESLLHAPESSAAGGPVTIIVTVTIAISPLTDSGFGSLLPKFVTLSPLIESHNWP